MKADGTEFPVEISITRIGHDDPPMFAAYIRDVTARKTAEETVRRLAAIVEHSNDAIVATDLRGTIVAWNPGAERLYGWTAAEIIGRHISATAPEDRHSEANFLARQVADGKAVSGHRTVRMRKDGSLVDVSLTISPIFGSDENPVGMAGIIRDITEEKRIEGERIRLLDQEKVARLTSRGARAARIVHRGGAGDAGQLAEVRRGPEAAHPPDRADARGLVRRAHAGGRRLDQAGGDRPRGPREGAAGRRARATLSPRPRRPAGSPGRAAQRRAPARARGHRRSPGGRRPRRGAPRDHPQPGAALGDGRPAAGAQSDARRHHLRVRGVRAPVRRRGPRIRVRAGAAGGAVDRQRAPAQRARQPQHGARVPGRRERATGRDASASRRRSRSWRAHAPEPLLADGCMVDLLDDAGNIVRVACGHLGPGDRARCSSELRAAAHRPRQRAPDRGCDAHRPAPAGRLHRRGVRASWTTDDRYLTQSATPPGEPPSWRRCGHAAGWWARSRSLRSATGGSARTTCGSCASSRGGPPSPWTTRAGTKETNYIADRLQRSLLPPHLPDIRGVDIATRFRPAGDRNEVGGDFYDIFQTGPNRWAITIGDVCGKGADAAAVTALARHTLRATAIRGGDRPDELLRTLNDAMLVDNPTDFQFCTVAFAGLERRQRVQRGWQCRAAGTRSRSCCAPAARSSPSANRARCSA